MALTPIPVVNPNTNAGGVVAPTAADNANNHSFPNDGDTLLFCECSGAITVTAVSVADRLGRTGNIAQVGAAGDLLQIGPLSVEGFNQSDGTVTVNVSSANGKMYAIRHKR